VIVPASIPKVTPFEFERMTSPFVALVVPALIDLIAAKVAVMVDALSPNDI
jgi:hypothetical protein